MKGKKRQAIMQKRREQNKAARNAEDDAYRRKIQEFQDAAAKSRKQKSLPKTPSSVDTLLAMDMTRKIPSACDRPIEKIEQASQDELSDDMQAREHAARIEAERRKGMVAPMWNKGGYQYLGDAPPEVIRGLGRKL